VLVLVLTVQCALWGAFLVPLRLCGVVAPVSVLFAVANAPLVYAGRRVARSRWGGAPPALLWLGLVLRLGTPTSGGDIAIEATPTGYAFLLIATFAAVVGIAMPHRPVDAVLVRAGATQRARRPAPGGVLKRHEGGGGAGVDWRAGGGGERDYRGLIAELEAPAA